ncbi:MAG: nucleoside triphosphate pyrophosphohydrolase [Deltaproteobacteria bacterium]|nr:nucleoside triphosphate pyrophosphohydrolase [Deltaproteobacteria bacterium]
MEKTVNPLPRGFEGLIALVRVLRSEEGCPWDRQQTPEQIKTYLLEEAYELFESIEAGNPEDVCGELGDLLFHIVFLARLFEETGDFTIEDVVTEIMGKMIRRHPHVFGQAKVNGVEDVRRRWLEIKMAEIKDKGIENKSPFESVPRQLPSLMRAYRISERAARLGFYRPGTDNFLEKLEESIAKVKRAVKGTSEAEAAVELGELLFTAVNLSRCINVHPEASLSGTIKEFEDRCRMMEKKLAEKGLSPASASTREIEAAWQASEKKK